MAMTETERKAFAEGYIAGWQSIPGVWPAMPPSVPENPKLMPGKPAYDQGYEEGRAIAAGK